MIGQEKLVVELNKLTLANFNTPILLLGPIGCGKHTLAQELANKLSLDIVNIDTTITWDKLIEYQQAVVDRLYLIDLANFTEKQQNQFLKFIEEPGTYNHIILINESEFGVLDTIINRCIKYHFNEYSKKELQQIINASSEIPDIIFNICKTPGQLLNYNLAQVVEIYNYCKQILTGIAKTSLANILSIATKINYKEEYDKYDFNLFFNTFLYAASEQFIASKSDEALKIYLFTNSYIQKLQNKALNKETFMLNFLIALKNILI